MRKRLLICIAAFFYFSGLVGLARWWTRRPGRRLIILNYHRATHSADSTGGDLRRHLLYLHRHYRIMHVEAALEELYGPCKGKHDRRTPLVLTFDDGYRDNYTHSFALARELHIPFTIYLIPGYVDYDGYFWWVESKRIVHRAQVDEVMIDGRMYHLNQPDERAALTSIIDSHVRHAQSVAERETFLASVRKTLAIPSSIPAEDMPSLPLTWEQVREMKESGWVSFGAHTMHHPILSYLADPDEVQREIEECRTVLEQRLGQPIGSFAYPVGQLQHIGRNVLQSVQQAGYDWALTTRYGFNTPQSDPYLLKRIEADVDQHWLVMAAEAAGLWGFFSRVRWLPAVRKRLTNSKLRGVGNGRYIILCSSDSRGIT